MNPSTLFKNSLLGNGGTGNSFLSSYGNGNSFLGTPAAKTTLPTLSSSVSQPATTPSGPMSRNNMSVAGGNTSATTPKQAYINSQTGATGTTAPSTGTGTSVSTAPVSTPNNTNANYSLQAPGNASTPPGNVDQNSSQYQYQKAFDTYLASLQPSDAETQAAKDLGNLQIQSQKDQDYALEKPGQTLGFASGEAARVNRNNAYGIDALTNKVNALTGARTASTNATKAQLDFEKGLYDDSTAAAKPDYTSVSPGSTVFDNKTGKSVYTAPTAASLNGDGSAGSTYVAGTDPIADGWITAINNKQATIAQVPAAYKNIVAQGLGATTQDDPLKTNALTSAQQLLTAFDNSSGFLGTPIGGARSAVGTSSALPVIPGTQAADFVANLDNLKSLLSLDNVKYLKGQGAVSDAERKLLADSATQLSRSQSEEQFKKTLQGIIDGLSKFGVLNGSSNTTANNVDQDPDYQAYLTAIGQ